MENHVRETRLEFLQHVAGYYNSYIYEKEGMYYLEDENGRTLQMTPNDLMFLSEDELRTMLERGYFREEDYFCDEEGYPPTDKEKGECSDCIEDLEPDWYYCPFCGKDLD